MGIYFIALVLVAEKGGIGSLSAAKDVLDEEREKCCVVVGYNLCPILVLLLARNID